MVYLFNVVSTGEVINGGSANFTANWSLNDKAPSIVIVKETLDLCDLLADVNLTCPVRSGHYNLNFKDHVPDVFPKVSKCICNGYFDE